jgi:hexosaminidase
MIKSSSAFRSILLKITFVLCCCSLSPVSAAMYNIIPYPQHLIPQSGKFTFNKRTVILCSDKNAAIQKLARQFSDQMALVSGLKLAVKDLTAADTTNAGIH